MSTDNEKAFCPGPERLFFLDNLKVFLVLLVLVCHAAMPYGGAGNLWFFETEQYHRWVRPFLFIHEGFVMGLFFIISGYFFPLSFDRNGAGPFIKGRLGRLGIPLVVVLVAVMPILLYAYYLNFRNHGTISFWKYLLNVYFIAGPKPANWTGPAWPDMRFGHMWFVEHLLIYAGAYTLLRVLSIRIRGRDTPPLSIDVKHGMALLPTHLFIIVFTLFAAAAAFFIRIWYPCHKWIAFLGFIQIEFAYFPYYLFLFCLGVVAFRRNWLWRLPRTVGLIWLSVGVAAAFLYFSKLLPTRQSLSFVVLESFKCVGLCIGLVVLFRDSFRGGGKIIKLLAANTYGVYIVHVPVLVCIQYYLDDFKLDPLLAVAFVIALGASISFLLSNYVLRRMPYAKNIIS